MGALTTGFMGSSSVGITLVQFSGNSGNATNSIILTLKNTGTKIVTIGQVKVNTVPYSFDTSVATLSTAASNVNMTIYNVGWSNGNPYNFQLYDTSGNPVGAYQANSPGS